MSAKAYRVVHIDYCKLSSFNLWHNQKLVEFLSDKYQFFVLMEDDDVGFVSLPIEALEHALEEVTMLEDVRDTLKTDIEAGKKTDGWVRYMVTYED